MEFKKLFENNIETECSLNLEKAIEGLRGDDYARECILQCHATLPILMDGTIMVWYTNDEGERQRKSQDFNIVVWLVILSTLFKHQQLSVKGLTTVLISWAKQKDICLDPNYKYWLGISEYYIQSLIALDWINPETTVKTELVEGKPVTYHVHEGSAVFGLMRKWIHEKLVLTVPMRCAPLRNKPVPWSWNESEMTGIGKDARLKFIKSDHAVTVSNYVIDQVNKLQLVAYTPSPVVMDIARDVIRDPGYYQALFKRTDDEWESDMSKWQMITTLEIGCSYYFPITLDHRTRMYYRGGSTHPQGKDESKALWGYAKALPLMFQGYGAICISAANALGIGHSAMEKVKIVSEAVTAPQMEGYLSNFRTFYNRFKPKDPLQAYVLLVDCWKAHQHYLAYGTYESYHSNVVCHQDGTFNGLQHIAAITCDVYTAKSVNLLPSSYKDRIEDLYTIVVDSCTHPYVKKYGRYLVKKGLLPAVYGAGEDTVKAHLNAFISKKGEKEDETCADEVFMVMHSKIPGLAVFSAELIQLGDAVVESYSDDDIKDGAVYWYSPDGCKVKHLYLDDEHLMVRGGTYSMRLPGVADVARKKMTTSLAPNIVHSFDACHARMVTAEANYDLTTVHDSFGSHAANFFRTNRLLRKTFVNMYIEQEPMKHVYNALGYVEPERHGLFDVAVVHEAVNSFS